MTNLFSTRQLIRHREPIAIDRVLYARINMILTVMFSVASAGLLVVLIALPDESGLVFDIIFIGILLLREYLKRKYTKYILNTSEGSEKVEVLSILKQRDRFGISLVEQVLMWGFATTLRSYWPIFIVLWITVIRLALQYRKLTGKTTVTDQRSSKK